MKFAFDNKTMAAKFANELVFMGFKFSFSREAEGYCNFETEEQDYILKMFFAIKAGKV